MEWANTPALVSRLCCRGAPFAAGSPDFGAGAGDSCRLRADLRGHLAGSATRGGRNLARLPGSDPALAPHCSRRRLPGQGCSSAAPAAARGGSVPRRAGAHESGPAAGPGLMWLQREITLDARPRGFHLVTRDVLDALPELADLEVGMLHLLIQHTSASLALSENASPGVRRDFEAWFNQAVPERAPY